MKREAGANAGKDEPHFSARNHAEPYHDPIDPALQHPKGTRLFAEDGGNGETRSEAEEVTAHKIHDIYPRSHGHKENGDEESDQGSNEFLNSGISLLRGEMLVVHWL